MPINEALQFVITTLDTIEVRGKENMTKLVSAIANLEKIREAVTAQPAEDE